MEPNIWVVFGKALVMADIHHYQQLEHRNDLLREVIDQLNKDFGSNVVELEWDNDKVNPYATFLESVEKEVETLLNQDKSTLMSILYRVDVFESKLQIVWMLEPAERVAKLTELILNRELQKVLTRHWYKQK